MSDHAPHFEENRLPQQTLLEQILDRGNMEQAWARVRSNKGAAGIDGMSVADFPAFSQVQMLRIIDQIRDGRYAPAPVKRVWIPKPEGTERPLGIPPVLDRVIQQAIAQVLGPIFDVGFSESSFGFRYGRQAHAAVERISEAAQAGYRWGVDCDLKGYFDTVNHDLLIAQLSQHINDKRMLIKLGIPADEVKKASRARKGYPSTLFELRRGMLIFSSSLAWLNITICENIPPLATAATAE